MMQPSPDSTAPEHRAVATFNAKFQQAVIILSTGRTGTQALARLLDQYYDEVKALHEPPPSWRLRLVSNRYLCGRLTEQKLIRIFTRCRRELLGRIRQPVYVESNWFLYGFISVFSDLFESPLIVHVVRDPRTYIPSYINFGTFSGLRWLASNCYPYWYIKPEQYFSSPSRRWRDMSEPERLAWHWRVVNTTLNRGPAQYKERYIRLKYEDLFAPDGRSLQRLIHWIGLPMKAELFEALHKEKINASSGRRSPKWQELPDDVRHRAMEHCAELMVEYGYPDREAA